MRVKVCGITQEEQLLQLPAAGVSFAGFIFYPKSPRYVLRYMTTSQIKKENTLNKVGVFVNASVVKYYKWWMNVACIWFSCMVMKPPNFAKK